MLEKILVHVGRICIMIFKSNLFKNANSVFVEGIAIVTQNSRIIGNIVVLKKEPE